MRTQKNNPNAIFVGFKEDESGNLVEVYIDPTANQYNTQQRRKLLSELGISVAGISGSITNIGKLELRLKELASDKKSTSRRNFLRAGAIVAGTIGLASCSKDDEPEINELEPPVSVITGPEELSIPKIGSHVKGTFDSKNSEGTITKMAWVLTTPCNLEPTITVGTESEVTHNFSIPGNYTLELYADNQAGQSIAKHEITVHPPELPKNKYDVPLAFFAVESPTPRGRKKALCTMDRESGEVTRLFGNTDKLYNHPNWSPSGNHLVFVHDCEESHYPDVPITVRTYNLLTGAISNISRNGSGMAWRPTWSPTGEWIAYLDDSRAPNYSIDEIAISRPNGSGKFFLGGDTSNKEYAGFALSWNPDGTSLVAGGNMLNQKRLVIFDDVLSGKPSKRSVLPTQKQVDRFYDAADFSSVPKDLFYRTFVAGPNGVAWSPDGKKIAYDISFAEEFPNNYNVLAMSNADGTGDITPLAISKGVSSDVPLWLPIMPTWSLDGETIYFIAWSYDEPHLYKVDLKTKKREMLLEDLKVKAVSFYD
ncbi:MAG: hypothetical protein ABFS32_19605 [Bacteroidota bacterium]